MKSYMVINTINTLYEQIVRYNPRFSFDEGIYFVCKVDSECYGYEDDGNTKHEEWCGRSVKWFHAIILNNNQVFTNVSDDFPIFDEIPQDGWTNTSNHDSCWRSGCDKLTSIGFDTWDEAHKNCPEQYRPATKDDGLHFDLSHGISKLFKLVEVEKESVYDKNTFGYHNKITKVEEIKKTVQV